MPNQTRPLNTEEMKSLTDDLQAVLKKHNCEMGVTSTINLIKVVENSNESATNTENKENFTPETDTEAESGS